MLLERGYTFANTIQAIDLEVCGNRPGDYTNRNTFVSPHFDGQPPFGNLSTPGFADRRQSVAGRRNSAVDSGKLCLRTRELPGRHQKPG